MDVGSLTEEAKELFRHLPTEIYHEIAKHDIGAYYALLGVPRFAESTIQPNIQVYWHNHFVRKIKGQNGYGHTYTVYMAGSHVHRTNGPAYVDNHPSAQGPWCTWYYQCGVPHRIDGPACILQGIDILGGGHHSEYRYEDIEQWWVLGQPQRQMCTRRYYDLSLTQSSRPSDTIEFLPPLPPISRPAQRMVDKPAPRRPRPPEDRERTGLFLPYNVGTSGYMTLGSAYHPFR